MGFYRMLYFGNFGTFGLGKGDRRVSGRLALAGIHIQPLFRPADDARAQLAAYRLALARVRIQPLSGAQS